MWIVQSTVLVTLRFSLQAKRRAWCCSKSNTLYLSSNTAPSLTTWLSLPTSGDNMFFSAACAAVMYHGTTASYCIKPNVIKIPAITKLETVDLLQPAKSAVIK